MSPSEQRRRFALGFYRDEGKKTVAAIILTRQSHRLLGMTSPYPSKEEATAAGWEWVASFGDGFFA